MKVETMINLLISNFSQVIIMLFRPVLLHGCNAFYTWQRVEARAHAIKGHIALLYEESPNSDLLVIQIKLQTPNFARVLKSMLHRTSDCAKNNNDRFSCMQVTCMIYKPIVHVTLHLHYLIFCYSSSSHLDETIDG